MGIGDLKGAGEVGTQVRVTIPLPSPVARGWATARHTSGVHGGGGRLNARHPQPPHPPFVSAGADLVRNSAPKLSELTGYHPQLMNLGSHCLLTFVRANHQSTCQLHEDPWGGVPHVCEMLDFPISPHLSPSFGLDLAP